MKGTVKWFNVQRGIGFITGEDEKDYFVHFSQILTDGFKKLKDGQTVSFETDQTEKGPQAVSVQSLS